MSRQMQGQIAEAVKLILEPDALKSAVVKLYQMHVEGIDHNRKSNADVEQEFARYWLVRKKSLNYYRT